MKIFIYKTLFVFLCLYGFYEFTVGSKIRFYEKRLNAIQSKENIANLKEKAREEMRSAIEKDQYLSPDDAELISKFLSKIQSEIVIEK